MMNTIKEIYGLKHDFSWDSGLVCWYNRMIDKAVDELDAADVSRMIRQGILKDVAFQRAVDIFIKNHYDGELWDGTLLNIMVLEDCRVSDEKVAELRELLSRLESEYSQFDWINKEEKNEYLQNVVKFKAKLAQA